MIVHQPLNTSYDDKTMLTSLNLTAVPGIPMIQPGDDLAAIFIDAIARAGIQLIAKDVLVIAQKIVSKAEGRYIDLQQITPSQRARELAIAVDKDPRLVELILSESSEVVRHGPGVLIVTHRLGFVMANAGIDRSNLEPEAAERVLLLPENPDASCAMLRTRLQTYFGVELAVIINDSFGRAWRNGTVGVALGAAGLPALLDLRGHKDLYGRELQVSETGFADEIAAAASLLMGQASEGQPLVKISGLDWDAPATNADVLLRPRERDLFR
jgi:coenzyme F420-0:L-glutamate ligase/coenzyme F420-1:gamma-L-glutamate ligase